MINERSTQLKHNLHSIKTMKIRKIANFYEF